MIADHLLLDGRAATWLTNTVCCGGGFAVAFGISLWRMIRHGFAARRLGRGRHVRRAAGGQRAGERRAACGDFLVHATRNPKRVILGVTSV
jgi:hypothetical protein